MAFALDADPRYGRFGLRTECPRCGAHLPVNGPAALVDCADCSHRVQVPGQILREMLDAFEDGWPHVRDAGSDTVGDLTWRWTSEAVAGPQCPACEATLDDRADTELVTCACGAQVRSVPPDGPVLAVRGVARVIGGELDQTRDAVHVAPVVLACPACGAGLTVTSEHQRITPCEHCSSQVHLPDAVWRQLHPPRTVKPWIVRFEGESRPAKEAREKQAEAERKMKARALAAERAKKQEEVDRARAAELEKQKAAEAAEKAEAERARRLRLLPLGVLSMVASLSALGLMGVATVAFVLGHSPLVPRYGSAALAARAVADLLVVSGAGAGVFAWSFGVLVAALRGGKPLGGVVFWSSFMAGMAVLPVLGPFVGLFWAWQHATDSEPTPDTDKLPRGTGWPLAPLYALGPLYAHVCYAAAGDMTLGEFLRFLAD